MDIGALGVYLCLFFALYFEVFLLISFIEKRPAKRTSALPTRYPTVSVVVPCFNESRTLAGTLDSLLALEYPKEKLNVMVIDDGSTDNTRTIGEAYAAKHPQVKYFRKENGGKYTALNFAIAHSNSEYIGCLDADSFVEPNALCEVMKKFEEENAAAIVPAMKVYNPRSMLELMQMAEYTFGIFAKKIFDNLGAIPVLPGPFSVYRRDVFNVTGPFRRAHNTEDMEIAFRMQKHGLKISNAHTAFVYTTVPPTLSKLLTQRTRWTQGFLQNLKDYWYMFGNPRFGNFGLFVLPFSFVMFFGTLYMAAYLVFGAVSSLFEAVVRIAATGILPHFSWPQLDWFYVDTSMTTFLVAIAFSMMVVSLLIGKKIAEAKFGAFSILSYLFIYSFVTPLWLMRALWGTLRAQESVWR